MTKQQWSVRRSTMEAPNAPRRWDRAYQLLLQGSIAFYHDSMQGSKQQEHSHEHRSLRPRIDTTTSTSPDDRTTDRQLAEIS